MNQISRDSRRPARRSSRRAAFLAVLAACVACACQPAAPAKRSVSLIHYFTGSLSAGVVELAAAFNREGRGIELVPTPLEHEAFKTAIRLQLEGPNPPDLFSYWAGDKTRRLVANGLVSPLDAIYRDAIPADAFSRSVLAALSYDGKPYMLPLTRHFVGFFYSQKIFSRLGLKPPRTWAELETLAATLAAHQVTPFALGGKSRWPLQFWFDYLMLRSAGFEAREGLVAGTVSWKDERVAASFRLWRSLVDRQWFNPDWPVVEWDKAAQRVVEGQAGMTLMGTWAIGMYNDGKFRYPEDYGFFTFPELDPRVENVALGPIDGILMSARPRSVSDCKDILIRLADARLQGAFNVAAGAIAPNSQVPGNAYPPLQREIKGLIESAPHWSFNFDLACPAEVSEAGLDGFVAFMRKPDCLPAVLDGLEKIRSGGGKSQ
jgi:multiple sugar transport system substrate-binding protein/raffinose/stachyose/melibiose transport system substrate-binding protein